MLWYLFWYQIKLRNKYHFLSLFITVAFMIRLQITIVYK